MPSEHSSHPARKAPIGLSCWISALLLAIEAFCLLAVLFNLLGIRHLEFLVTKVINIRLRVWPEISGTILLVGVCHKLLLLGSCVVLRNWRQSKQLLLSMNPQAQLYR